MNAMLQKIKFVFIIWGGLSILGGVAVTEGIDASLASYACIGALFFLYYFYYNWSSLPVREADSSVVLTESETFKSEVEGFKQRAIQIYEFKFPDQEPNDVKIIKKAYKSALLDTIVYAGLEKPINVYFTSYFNEVLKSPREDIKSPSIDQLVVELSSKRVRTKLQNEYLSYVTCQVTSRGRGVEELGLAYQISSGHLSVKRLFSNWLGLYLVKSFKLIDLNRNVVGLEDFTNLELPPPNKSINMDAD